MTTTDNVANESVSDPLHHLSPPDVRWTTRNANEALPGVPTPLSVTIWLASGNYSMREMFRGLGAYSTSDLNRFAAQGIPFVGVFYGHLAANLDLPSVAISRLPGGDAGKYERDFFGLEPSDHTPAASRHRWAAVATRAPISLIRNRRRLRALIDQSQQWWYASRDADLPPVQARATVEQGIALFNEVMRAHIFESTITSIKFGIVASLAAKAGHVGLELDLLGGTPDLEESRVTDDLWALSRDELELSEFIARHGYHGPNEGELSSRVWRENPEALSAIAEAYRTQDSDESPAAARQRRLRDREAAIRAVEQGLANRLQRSVFRTILNQTALGEELRESGKAAFLRTLDGIRRATRVLGTDLALRGILEEPDDVFYLTIDELRDIGRVPEPRATVAFRRERRREYEQMELAPYWIGNPDKAFRSSPPAEPPTSIRGVPASAGRATGRARVILDPESCDEPLDHDEILVARTTDPAWVSLFMTAAGLVIDIGGPLSHAAIIARSLGIPCVINTEDGTQQIPDGAPLTIDGSNGTVEIHPAASIDT
jgi:pyruvate,water dikinase